MEITVIYPGIFRKKKTVPVNQQFCNDVEQVWKLYDEFKQKSLTPTPEYFNSRLPEHFFDVVPFYDTTGIENPAAFYEIIVKIKRKILYLIEAIAYHKKTSYSFEKCNSGKKRYITMHFYSDVYKGRNGIRVIQWKNSARTYVCYREDSEVEINLPDSRPTPEGAIKDGTYAQQMIDNVWNLFYDNGLLLTGSKSIYGGPYGSVFSVDVTFPDMIK